MMLIRLIVGMVFFFSIALNAVALTPASLELHYLFDEGNGQNTADASGNSRAGVFGNNSPTWLCNATGFHLNFERENQQSLSTPSFTPPEDGAVAFWFKIPKDPDDPEKLEGRPASRQRVFGFHDGWEIRWESTGIMHLDINKTGTNDTLVTNKDTWAFDTWIHIAVVTSVTDNTWSVYIDGVLDNSYSDTEPESLSAQSAGVLTLGTRTGSNNYFSGSLDDFRIYSGVLTETDITALAATPPRESDCLVAHYAMDEESWLVSGTPVLDSINGFNGTAFNGADTIGSTCRYGQFDGENDYIEIPHYDDLNGNDALTYIAYIRPDSWSGVDQIMAKSVHGGGSGRAQMGIFSEHGVFKVRAETKDGREGISASLPTPLGDWVHIAAVFNGTSLVLYQDGVLVASDTFSSTTLTQTTDALNISKRVGSSNYYFHGLIDDVRVYTSALSQQDVVELMTSVEPCSLSPVDHFEINHDGQGLTCEVESITIKACANESCSSLNHDTTDVQLLINGIFDKTVTVSGGSAETSFSYIDVDSAATLSLDQSYECKNGSSSNCDLVFTNAGFRFLYGMAESNNIDSQISGNNFSDIVKIQAVENVNGVCAGLFTGNKVLELSQQNIDPGGSSGLSFMINGNTGTSIAKYPNFTSNITLNFDLDSKAIIPSPVYLDAGQIRLYANYDVDGVSVVGSSNDFWVSPYKLVASVQSGGSDLNGNTDNSARKHKAGQAFDFNITAFNSLGSTSAYITSNYKPNDMQFLLTRTGPTIDGVNGLFSYDSGSLSSLLTEDVAFQSVTLNAFAEGISSTDNASYSEVGILTLDLQDQHYGFTGNVIAGDAINIGRFTPDHFEQTVAEHGALDTVCNQNTAFAYIGQVLESDASKGAISYLVNPVVELTAKNVQGVTTQNYTATGYTKLNAAANFIITPTTDSTIRGRDTNLLPLTADISTGTVSHSGLVASQPEFGLLLAEGVLHYELADDDNFSYNRNENGEINAQDNDIDFVIDQANFVDSDGIAIVDPVNITDTTGINLRFGRGILANSFGPETAELPQYLSTQYLNASGNYVVNEQDDCTNFDANDVTKTSGTLDETTTDVNIATGQVSNGQTRAIILTAPGAGNLGTINVEYNIDPWLQYDWNWNGVEVKDFNENPTAVATFGIYRGNDRIIYHREITN